MSTTAPIPPTVPDAATAHPVQPVATTAPVQSQSPGQVVEMVASRGPVAPIDDQHDLRLVIEEDKAAGSYVYKTVDPRTGKVISQIPREELLRIRDTSGYTPGSIVNSRS